MLLRPSLVACLVSTSLATGGLGLEAETGNAVAVSRPETGNRALAFFVLPAHSGSSGEGTDTGEDRPDGKDVPSLSAPGDCVYTLPSPQLCYVFSSCNGTHAFFSCNTGCAGRVDESGNYVCVETCASRGQIHNVFGVHNAENAADCESDPSCEYRGGTTCVDSCRTRGSTAAECQADLSCYFNDDTGECLPCYESGGACNAVQCKQLNPHFCVTQCHMRDPSNCLRTSDCKEASSSQVDHQQCRTQCSIYNSEDSCRRSLGCLWNFEKNKCVNCFKNSGRSCRNDSSDVQNKWFDTTHEVAGRPCSESDGLCLRNPIEEA